MPKPPEIRLGGFRGLFGADTSKRIVKLPLDELHQHPRLQVHVQDGKYIDELAQSIKEHGLLEDVRAFPDPEGGYWIISGRHRCKAARKAGLDEVSVILDDSMTQEDAEIAITDCNLRHELGIMEKAWTYRIKRDAENRQGERTDLHGKPPQQNPSEESERTIQRYIRLTYLIPELQARTEAKGKAALKLRTGAALSYLEEDTQRYINDYISKSGILPTQKIAESWRDLAKAGKLGPDDIDSFFQSTSTTSPGYKVALSSEQLAEWLPADFTAKETEELLLQLVREWAGEKGN